MSINICIEQYDIEKFDRARAELEIFLEAHSDSTMVDLIERLGWAPDKVNILLDLLIQWGVANPYTDSSGVVRYRYEQFFVALVRRLKKEKVSGQFKAPSPLLAKEGAADHLLLLKRKGLL